MTAVMLLRLGSDTGRREHKGCAEDAKGILKNTKNHSMEIDALITYVFFIFLEFLVFFSLRLVLRPLRNFCDLCVRQFAFNLRIISQTTGAAK
jgi:hypothetical protein